MAKEIVAWCDVCLQDEVQTTASTHQLTLSGKTHELDLCETHDKELLEPIRLLLAEAGQPVQKQSKSDDGRVACSICGKQLKTRDTLSKHVRRMHSTDEQLAAVSRTIEAEEAAGAKPYDCPDCDSSFETPQGRGAHRSRAHGYRATDKAQA